MRKTRYKIKSVHRIDFFLFTVTRKVDSLKTILNDSKRYL
jgi:hypothetical protein